MNRAVDGGESVARGTAKGDCGAAGQWGQSPEDRSSGWGLGRGSAPSLRCTLDVDDRDVLPPGQELDLHRKSHPRPATLVRVTVNGQAADLYGDYFVAEDVPLNTEGEHGITVVATDAVSRTGQDQITVVRDTVPPSLTIDAPADGATVHTRWVPVSGTVENGIEWVVVNGSWVQPDGTDWSTDVLVETEGQHTVTARCSDPAGNETEDAVYVTLNLPPELRVDDVGLSDQSTGDTARCWVGGTVDDPEAGVRVIRRRGQRGVTVEGTNDGGELYVDGVPLAPGKNILTVQATDADGQTSELDVVIEFDPGDDTGYDEIGSGAEGEAPPAAVLDVEPQFAPEPLKVGSKLDGDFPKFGGAGDHEIAPVLVNHELTVPLGAPLTLTVSSPDCTTQLTSATFTVTELTDGGSVTVTDSGSDTDCPTVTAEDGGADTLECEWKATEGGTCVLDAEVTLDDGSGPWPTAVTTNGVLIRIDEIAATAPSEDWTVPPGTHVSQGGDTLVVLTPADHASLPVELTAPTVYGSSGEYGRSIVTVTEPDGTALGDLGGHQIETISQDPYTVRFPAEPGYSYEATLYLDANGNGQFDAGESGQTTTVAVGSYWTTPARIVAPRGQATTFTVHTDHDSIRFGTSALTTRETDRAFGTYTPEDVFELTLARPEGEDGYLEGQPAGWIHLPHYYDDGDVQFVPLPLIPDEDADQPWIHLPYYPDRAGLLRMANAHQEDEKEISEVTEEELAQFVRDFLDKFQVDEKGRSTKMEPEEVARALYYFAAWVRRTHHLGPLWDVFKFVGKGLWKVFKKILEHTPYRWVKDIIDTVEKIIEKFHDPGEIEIDGKDPWGCGGTAHAALDGRKNVKDGCRDFVITVKVKISLYPPTQRRLDWRDGTLRENEKYHWESHENKKGHANNFKHIIITITGKWNPDGKTLEEKFPEWKVEARGYCEIEPRK